LVLDREQHRTVTQLPEPAAEARASREISEVDYAARAMQAPIGRDTLRTD